MVMLHACKNPLFMAVPDYSRINFEFITNIFFADKMIDLGVKMDIIAMFMLESIETGRS